MKTFKFFLLFLLLPFFYTQAQTHELADWYWDKAEKAVEQEDWANAAKWYEKSAEAEKKSPKPRFEDLLIELDNAAYYYSLSDKHNKALPIYLEVIVITKNIFGKDHSEYGMSLSNLALLYLEMGLFKKALPLFLEALENIEKTLGKDHAEYGIVLSNLAGLYEEIGQYKKALPFRLEALDNTGKTLGKNHIDYIEELSNLAGLYQDMGQYEKALPLNLEALDKTELILGKNRSEYGVVLNKLAGLYKDMGLYDKASPLLIKAIENIKITLGVDDPFYGILLNNLGMAYRFIGQYKKAMPLLIESLEIAQKTLGKDHSVYGLSLNNLALLYQDMGEYDKALPLFINAIENTEKTLGENNSVYGLRINNLAMLYKDMMQFEKALPFLIRALENTEKTLGKDHSQYGSVLNNLAGLYQDMAQYDKALPLFLEAIESHEKSLVKNHSQYRAVLNNLANLYRVIGFYDKALPLYIEALENTEKKLGKDSNYYIGLGNLGSLYENMGQYDKALPLLQEALENARINLSNNPKLYMICLNNLGMLYQSIGEYDKALPLLKEALLKDDNTNNGRSLYNLALLYYEMGQYDKALPLLQEALVKNEKTFGKSHENYGLSLISLATLHVDFGQFKKAIPLLREGNTNAFYQIKKNFAFQNEESKEKYIKNIIGNSLEYFSMFNFLTNNSYRESVDLATNNILTSKGLLLNASKNILTKLESLNNNAINKKITLFRSKRTFINNQLQLPLNKRVVNFLKQKEDLEILENELVKLYSTNFNEDINYIKDWKQTQLKDNELAVEFTYFDHYNKKWTDSTMYVAYLYKKDWETPKVVNLFEEKQLTKYFSSTNNPNTLYASRGSVAKSTKAKLAVADSIYNLVWKPLEKYLDVSSTIYFSPDGLLHKIPFAALPNQDNKLIGELYNINQMGNTADIGKNINQPNLDDILLIGGINYEYIEDTTKPKKEYAYSVLENEDLLGNENNRSISRTGFAYLPGTEKEINDITSILGSKSKLSGYNATESAFKKLSGNSPSVLHIATHGFFFKKPKKEAKKNRFLGQENTYRHHENPLLRSGLLFANANYAWQNGNNPYEEDDGILTALEISNLDLKNTDIVILSACETGLGDIEGSEGVFGLQRAFKMAGVKTIIMSLWPVPDAETAEFMNLFYTNWKQFNNPKKAFKVTQQQMMNKYRETPEKWAAFVYFE